MCIGLDVARAVLSTEDALPYSGLDLPYSRLLSHTKRGWLTRLTTQDRGRRATQRRGRRVWSRRAESLGRGSDALCGRESWNGCRALVGHIWPAADSHVRVFSDRLCRRRISRTCHDHDSCSGVCALARHVHAAVLFSGRTMRVAQRACLERSALDVTRYIPRACLKGPDRWRIASLCSTSCKCSAYPGSNLGGVTDVRAQLFVCNARDCSSRGDYSI